MRNEMFSWTLITIKIDILNEVMSHLSIMARVKYLQYHLVYAYVLAGICRASSRKNKNKSQDLKYIYDTYSQP